MNATLKPEEADTLLEVLYRGLVRIRILAQDGDTERVEAIADALDTHLRKATVFTATRSRLGKLSSLDAQIRNLKTAPQSIMAEIQRLERLALSRLADFRKVLRGSADAIRAFLTNLFEGPLKFRADGEYFLTQRPYTDEFRTALVQKGDAA